MQQIPEVKKTILLVEDQAILAMNAARHLTKNGYQVIVATSGEESVEKALAQSLPDLVLMDINLGNGMDGTEAAELILKERAVPVVFLSEHIEPEYVEKTEKITSYGYVVKNSGEAVLIASIKMAFRLFDAHRQIQQRGDLLEQSLEKHRQAVEREHNLAQKYRIAAESNIKSEMSLREKEESLRLIIDNMVDLVARFDAQANFIYVSPAYERVLGYTPEELIGHPATSLLHPYNQMAEIQAIDAMLERGSGSVQFRFRHKDGSYRWFEATGRHLYGPDGQPAGSVIGSRDITQRKRAEEAQRSSETQYRAVFTTMQEGFALHEIICDQQGRPVDYRFIDCNPAFEQLTGLKREALVGKTVREAMPNIEEEWIERYGQVALSGIPQRFENIAQDLKKYYSVFAYQTDAERGQFAVIFLDISERKQAEDALRDSLKENKLLLRELQHRIKNSMGLITGILDLERNLVNHPDTLRVLSNVRDRIHTLSDLYSLLYTANNTQKVQLDEYIGEILSSLQAAYRHGVSNYVIHAELTPLLVNVQIATSFGLILNELVTNALKYAFRADVPGTIWIYLLVEHERLVLRVENDGLGLPDHFDLGKKLGFGLQLVKMLADDLHGSLSMERGERTVFRVSAALPQN
jgi:PAS domain S-box-containing protein